MVLTGDDRRGKQWCMTSEEARAYLLAEYAVSAIELDDADHLATLRARWALFEQQDGRAMEALDVLENHGREEITK